MGAVNEAQTGPHRLLINGEQVETVTTFRFMGTHISADHSWTFNIRTLVKKVQQWNTEINLRSGDATKDSAEIKFKGNIKKEKLGKKMQKAWRKNARFNNCC